MNALRFAVALIFAFTSTVSQAKPAAEFTTSVIVSRDCIVTGTKPSANGQAFIGAVAAILLPMLIEMGIDALSTDLKKVRTVKSSGEVYFDLYGLSAKNQPILRMPGCITVITGEMKPQSRVNESPIHADTSIDANSSEGTILKRLNDNGVTVDTGKLYSVIEVEVETSADRTAFRYAPRYVRVLKLMPGNNGKAQGLVLNLSMSGAGASPNGTIYSLAPVSLGTASERLALDRVSDPDKIERMKTGYLAMPGMSDLSLRAYFQDMMTGKTSGSYMPSNFKAELVQTQKPSDLAVFVANVLDKAKPKLSEAAGTAIKDMDPFKVSQAKLDARIAVAQATADLADANAGTSDEKKALAKLKLDKAQAALDELNR